MAAAVHVPRRGRAGLLALLGVPVVVNVVLARRWRFGRTRWRWVALSTVLAVLVDGTLMLLFMLLD